MRFSVRLLSNDVLHFPENSSVFRFGTAMNPILRNVNLTIANGEGWAVMGSGKGILLETILGRHRVAPSPQGGLFPFLNDFDPPRDPQSSVSQVSFTYRQRVASAGAFYDYTARYGAVREEDRITVRETLSVNPQTGLHIEPKEIDHLADRLQIKHLLDLPLVALSNGQTRRATVMQKILQRPKVLVLDEPLTGLDKNKRPLLMDLLGEFHRQNDPHIILALRPLDPLPDWITHIAFVQDDTVISGPVDDREIVKLRSVSATLGASESVHVQPQASPGKTLVEINNLNVGYNGRKVLQNLTWTIREGERWHLVGPNGSGKTTLLSILTGDHPQSYIQKQFFLFGRPRTTLATAQIQRQIGIVSPEIFNAFPRRLGPGALSARDAIATGFESTYSYRPRTPEQDTRIDTILSDLGIAAESRFDPSQPFASLKTSHQALVLFIRALVNQPPLLILDEVFAGMDDAMITAAKQYLRKNLSPAQSVIFVTHWEEELPWPTSETLRLTLGAESD